jgi:hypothetical protein
MKTKNSKPLNKRQRINLLMELIVPGARRISLTHERYVLVKLMSDHELRQAGFTSEEQETVVSKVKAKLKPTETIEFI